MTTVEMALVRRIGGGRRRTWPALVRLEASECRTALEDLWPQVS